MDIHVNPGTLKTHGEKVNSIGSDYSSEINSLYTTIDFRGII